MSGDLAFMLLGVFLLWFGLFFLLRAEKVSIHLVCYEFSTSCFSVCRCQKQSQLLPH